MEEKFTFHAADKVIDVKTGFEQIGAKSWHDCLKMVFFLIGCES